MLEIEGLRVSEAKIFRCAGSLRRCAPALARRLRRRAYPDLYVDPRHPGGPVTTPRGLYSSAASCKIRAALQEFLVDIASPLYARLPRRCEGVEVGLLLFCAVLVLAAEGTAQSDSDGRY